jgi:hypothetical protein
MTNSRFRRSQITDCICGVRGIIHPKNPTRRTRQAGRQAVSEWSLFCARGWWDPRVWDWIRLCFFSLLFLLILNGAARMGVRSSDGSRNMGTEFRRGTAHQHSQHHAAQQSTAQHSIAHVMSVHRSHHRRLWQCTSFPTQHQMKLPKPRAAGPRAGKVQARSAGSVVVVKVVKRTTGPVVLHVKDEGCRDNRWDLQARRHRS